MLDALSHKRGFREPRVLREVDSELEELAKQDASVFRIIRFWRRNP